MSLRIILRAPAADDLCTIVDYLSQQDAALALRFANSAQTTFAKLAEFPGLGSPKAFRSRRLKGIRSWPVAGFPNHLIFYRPITDAIEIVAVLHGARNLLRALNARTR